MGEFGDRDAHPGADGRKLRRRAVVRAIREAGRRYHLDLTVTLLGFPSGTSRTQVLHDCDAIVKRVIRRSTPLTLVSKPQDADLLVRVTLKLTGLSAHYQTAQGTPVGRAMSGVRAAGHVDVIPGPVLVGAELRPGAVPGYGKGFSGMTDPPSTTSRRVLRSGPFVEAAISKGLEPRLKAMSRKLWR